MHLITCLVFIIGYFFFFVSCQSVKSLGNNGSVTSNVKKEHTFKKKNHTPFVKKVWIRETFVKNLARPSLLQSIKPVLTSHGLLVQGNKVNGISAYTLRLGKRKWFFPVKGGLAGGVLVSNGFVFFGGADGVLYSLDLQSGTVVWKQPIGLTSVSTPVVYGSYLYLASPNKIYCLNLKTGDNVWTYSTQVKNPEFVVEGVASPLVEGSLIYFKVSDDSLVALDFKGRLKWKKSLARLGSRFASASSNPVMGKVCLYVAGLESGLYCLNKKTGKIIWNTSFGSHGNILLSGSLVFYSSHDGKVVALDQKSGKEIWSHKVPESIATSLVSYKDMLIYGEYSGALRFISKDKGEELSSFSFGSGMSAPPVVLEAESELYFISNAGWLYKLRLI